MPMPRSVTRANKNGVKIIDSVDKAQYTIDELTRAALRDSAKLIRKRIVEKQKQLPGMKRSRRLYRSTQYWVRRRESDLQVGFKHDSWYGARSELGAHGSPPRGFLRDTVHENIDEIRRIQAQYLSAITTDSAGNKIDESEYKSPDGAE